MTLCLLSEVEGAVLPEAMLRQVLGGAYAARAEEDATVNLLVVDDPTIAEMNQRHLQHEGPTDVLSFDDGEADPETGVCHLGDIAISLETARREGTTRGVEADHELVLYALHGLLHLLGMRDHTDALRREMNRVQREELTRYGVPYKEDN